MGLGFSAFDFQLGPVSVEFSMELVGQIMFDLAVPDGDGLKNALAVLFNPDTFKDMSSSSIPGFQVTVDGALGMTVALGGEVGGWEFSTDLGSVTATVGVNMGNTYPGFSDGIYATA